MHDIVYILRNGVRPDELRYSLRSVEANLEHGRVWFYGGGASGLKPDCSVYMYQRGQTKWARVAYTLKHVCANDDITPQFYLFNDDFYVMEPCDAIPPYHDGPIREHAQRIIGRRGGVSAYCKNLLNTADILERNGYGTNNYAIHVPLLVDRAKALETLRCFDGYPMFRNLYGNQWEIGGTFMRDVKVHDTEAEPGATPFLSTSDKSFSNGEVGRYIRAQFPNKCRYEV